MNMSRSSDIMLFVFTVGLEIWQLQMPKFTAKILIAASPENGL